MSSASGARAGLLRCGCQHKAASGLAARCSDHVSPALSSARVASRLASQGRALPHGSLLRRRPLRSSWSGSSVGCCCVHLITIFMLLLCAAREQHAETSATESKVGTRGVQAGPIALHCSCKWRVVDCRGKVASSRTPHPQRCMCWPP